MKNPPPPVVSPYPGRRKPMMRIIHASHERKTDVILVNQKEFGVMVHWNEEVRRNQPCTGEFCRCQQTHLPLTWKAYLGCWDVSRQQLAIAELTSPAWLESGLMKLREKDGTLRGLKVQLSRFANQKTGRVIAKVFYTDEITTGALPPSFDTGEELQRIWYSRL